MLTQPFDYNPLNTVIQANTYTVPANRYALVNINAWAKAFAIGSTTLQDGSQGGRNLNNTSDYQKNSIGIWLKAGDVLTSVKTNASGTGNISGNGPITLTYSTKAETITEVLLNGVTLFKVSAIATISFSGELPAVAPYNITLGTFSGDSGVHIQASEYKIVD